MLIDTTVEDCSVQFAGVNISVHNVYPVEADEAVKR
jgi:hypothetical protein